MATSSWGTSADFDAVLIFSQFEKVYRAVSATAFIGGGKMAQAIISGLVKSGRDTSSLFVADVAENVLQSCGTMLPKENLFSSSKEMLCDFDEGTVVLAIKPQNLADIQDELQLLDSDKHALISILAGIKTQKLEAMVREGVSVIRVMPNTPALVGKGISVLSAGGNANASHLAEAKSILESVGSVIELGEDHMDAVTAVSGSGPAYFFSLIKHLVDAGCDQGLPPDVSMTLALSTAAGASELACQAVREDGQTLSELINAVSSKGGTTEAALKVFVSGEFDKLVLNAVGAAAKRSKELGE